MYMPVRLAVLDDLGVAADDRRRPPPARRAAIARTSASSISVGSPASSTNVVTSATGRAPDTARSFTVPFTASSPIEPPGNRSGVTTKLSVVIASRRAADCDARRVAEPIARPASSGRRAAARTGRRPAAGCALPPAPCAISICGSRNRIAGAAPFGGRVAGQAGVRILSEAAAFRCS